MKSWQYLAEEFSKNNAAGVKFEIVPIDNKLSPQETTSALRSAMDQGVRYVVQGNGSGPALAIIDALDKHNARNKGKEVVYLNYAAGGQKFKAKLKAAGAPSLQQAQVVTIWKVRPGPDKRVGRATTAGNGGFSVAKKAKPGRYYASAGSVLVPATGAATEVTTTKLKLP